MSGADAFYRIGELNTEIEGLQKMIEGIHEENCRAILLLDKIDVEIKEMDFTKHASVSQGMLTIKGLIAEYDAETKGDDNGQSGEDKFTGDSDREG